MVYYLQKYKPTAISVRARSSPKILAMNRLLAEVLTEGMKPGTDIIQLSF